MNYDYYVYNNYIIYYVYNVIVVYIIYWWFCR